MSGDHTPTRINIIQEKMMTKHSCQVDIRVPELEGGWVYDVEIEYDTMMWMDETNVLSEITEAVVQWCSDNGYEYDGSWEYA